MTRIASRLFRLPVRLAVRLAVLLAVLLVQAALNPADAADGGPHGNARRPWKIAMVTWRGETQTEAGFRDYLASVHMPVTLLTYDAGSQRERLPDIVARIKADRPDLVYAWGSEVAAGLFGPHDAQDAARHITDIPSIFVNVSVPVEIGLVRSLEAPGRNVTGALYLASPEAQVQAMASYRPFDTLAVVYAPGTSNAQQKLDQLRPIARASGFTLVEIPLGSDGGVARDEDMETAMAAAAAAKAGFVYLPSDSLLVAAKAGLTAAAVRHRLPVFAGTEELLENSQALGGLVGRYYDAGQIAGAQADDILVHKRRPQDMPITALPRFSFILNMAVARELELYPPMSLLHIVEVRGTGGPK
jgi:putative ABC transport system substrate-binding protein